MIEQHVGKLVGREKKEVRWYQKKKRSWGRHLDRIWEDRRCRLGGGKTERLDGRNGKNIV
jgi:hypothetical protein